LNISRNAIVWIVAIVLLFALFNFFNNSRQQLPQSEEAYTDFIGHVESGRISEVKIVERNITATTKDGQKYQTYMPDDPRLMEKLDANNVTVRAEPRDDSMGISDLLTYLLPTLLLIGAWIFIFRQMQGGRGGGLGIGKSKAKLLTHNQDRVTFEDVAGIDESKQDVEEIVEFLREPGKFQRLGGKIPKGVLLVGLPGTGKTLLARAIAGEANVPFFSIAGSDFVEMFVGVGASRVRDMFEQAKKNAPCILFIDEIDAVGRSRSQGVSGGHEEREQTLNQLLVEMDGFEANEGIIIIAATNRADVLDKALLRPGRFDRQVQVPLPDVIGREKILKVHVKNVPLSPDVDLQRVAKGTPGFSGAEIANLVNEAALGAARGNKRVVTMEEFEQAKDKITMGPERRSAARTQEEIELVAYHESGHAIVGMNVPIRDKLNKLTIIPRGQAGGYAQFLPERDGMFATKDQMEAVLAMTFGGRIAEELIYGEQHITNGASSDIRQATHLARMMIEEWGFSEKVGPLFYAKDDGGYFGMGAKDISDESAAMIDTEIRRLVDNGMQQARDILTKHTDGLHRLKDALLEYETLTAEEVQTVLDGGDIDRPDPEEEDAHGGGPRLPSSGALPTVNRGPLGSEPEPAT
jgi:cell division protease FtsH